jgi:RNA polymerase sigma-70 factor (ECF subfamily)
MLDHLNTDPPYSDLELFERIASGDKWAFTEVYLRYAPLLLKHVTQLLDSRDWAEEIVQDVFTRLWEARPSLSTVSQPRAYLYRIASNLTLDLLRHRSVEVKAQYWLARNSGAVSDPGIEAQFDFWSSRQLVEEAVNHLTAQKKLIYLLKNEEGYSYEEIAKTVHLSRNTVRNHLADAVQYIRRYLLEHGVVHVLWLIVGLSLIGKIFS